LPLYVIAFVATEATTSNAKEDVIPVWTSGGNGTRNPDFIVPGRSLPQNHPRALGVDSTTALAGPSGATWSGGTWSGATWSGATWSGETWTAAFWD
jgi:hypothetical protein